MVEITQGMEEKWVAAFDFGFLIGLLSESLNKIFPS